MKSTAVLIYDSFCSFEISVALEMLALAGKPITVFAQNTRAVRSEEGLTVLPDKTTDDFMVDAYDSLLLPGAADIRSAAEDKTTLSFISDFAESGCVIGAISIAPVLLLKCGLLIGRPFMAGVNREELIEEGFTASELSGMVGWDDCIRSPVFEGCIRTGNIITSVSFEFVRWALAFGRMVGIDVPARTFGL